MPHVGHIAKRCVWLIGIGVNIIAVSTDISAIANAIAEVRRSKTKEIKNMEQVKWWLTAPAHCLRASHSGVKMRLAFIEEITN